MTDLGINWSYKQKKFGDWEFERPRAALLRPELRHRRARGGRPRLDRGIFSPRCNAPRGRGLPLQVLAAQTDYRVTDYRVTEALRHRGPPSPQLRRPRQSTPASRTSWLPSPPTPSPSRVHYLNEVTIRLQVGEFEKEEESHQDLYMDSNPFFQIITRFH